MAPRQSRHLDGALGLPGRQITSAVSITAAKLRDRMALGGSSSTRSALLLRSWQFAHRHLAHRLGRDIARRDAEAAGGQDQLTALIDLRAQRALNVANLIRHDILGQHFPAVNGRGLVERRATGILVDPELLGRKPR